ncbi:hypothetical protein [Mucilaginibacter pineti]|nr:hypothetical protein [Mucilaginibacter pineti]
MKSPRFDIAGTVIAKKNDNKKAFVKTQTLWKKYKSLMVDTTM